MPALQLPLPVMAFQGAVEVESIQPPRTTVVVATATRWMPIATSTVTVDAPPGNGGIERDVPSIPGPRGPRSRARAGFDVPNEPDASLEERAMDVLERARSSLDAHRRFLHVDGGRVAVRLAGRGASSRGRTPQSRRGEGIPGVVGSLEPPSATAINPPLRALPDVSPVTGDGW